MASHNLKQRKGKGLSLFLFPILMLTFVLGWCLYIMGDDKRTKGTRVKPIEESKVQEDNLNIFALPIEEEQEVMSS